MSQQTVTINGTVYDAHTGLPISKNQPVVANTSAHTPAQSRPSHTIHQQTQKSQTLNRAVVRKAAAKATKPRMDIQKSQSITKFAPHPAGVKQPRRSVSDIGPVAHPMASKAHQQMTKAATQPAKTAPKPSQVIKQEAITEAMSQTPEKNHAEQKPAKRSKKFQRFVSVGSVSVALLLLGGYFTYLNMPSLSVRVAAAQAGVNATYPEFRPDGYSLSGAVAYSEGQVSMKFASNSGPQNYTINQSKSSWDSSAVKNDVEDKTDGKYITYNERGLTIYTYGSNAAWVNGGILYTINGDAPLSSDQIRRIATSL